MNTTSSTPTSTNPFDYAGTGVENRVLISVHYPHGGRSMADLPGKHGNIQVLKGDFTFSALTGHHLENMYVNAEVEYYVGVFQALGAWGEMAEWLKTREPYDFIGCAYIGYSLASLDILEVESPFPEERGRFLSLKALYPRGGRGFRIDDEPMWHMHRLVINDVVVIRNELLKLLPMIAHSGRGAMADEIMMKSMHATEQSPIT